MHNETAALDLIHVVFRCRIEIKQHQLYYRRGVNRSATLLAAESDDIQYHTFDLCHLVQLLLREAVVLSEEKIYECWRVATGVWDMRGMLVPADNMLVSCLARRKSVFCLVS